MSLLSVLSFLILTLENIFAHYFLKFNCLPLKAYLLLFHTFNRIVNDESLKDEAAAV